MKKTFVFLLFLTQSCYAGDSSSPPNYKQVHKPFIPLNCLDAQTQPEMDACHRKSLANLDGKMTNILTQLKKNYRANEPSLLKVLEKSQTAWESYKSASCDVETYYSRDGSGYESILSICLETKVNERISYLQWMLDHP